MCEPAAHKTLTADGAVKTGPGALVAVVLTGGSDQASVVLYDNTAASGTVLCMLTVAANSSGDFAPCLPYVFSKGIYADLSGTNPSVTVVFL